jgi:GntR family transcriptional regulator
LTFKCVSVLYKYNTNTPWGESLKFNTTSPIYLQIIDEIKKDIVTGTLSRGGRLDSVRSLAEKFGVNLNTMQRACSELERQGIIYTQRGIGSFITEDDKMIVQLKEAMSAKLIESFVSGLANLGYQKSEILEILRKALEK